MIRTDLRRIVQIVTVALVATIFCGQSDRAAAAEFQIHSCTTGLAVPTSEGWTFSGAIIFARNDQCPLKGLSAIAFSAVTRGASYTWQLTPASSAPIKTVTLTLSGGGTGSGFDFVVADCPNCAPLRELSTSAQNNPQTLELPGIHSVAIRAVCALDQCNVSDAPAIRDVILTLDDRDPPALDDGGFIVNRPPLAGPRDYYGHEPWYRHDEIGLRAEVSDTGSGLAYAKIMVDGSQEIWRNRPDSCLYFDDLITASGFGGCLANAVFLGVPGLTAIPDGRHEFRVNAEDTMGNLLDQELAVVNVDGTPPGEPANVEVSGRNDSGWTTSQYVDLTWLNDGPPPLGARTGQYDIVPLDDGAVDPPPVFITATSGAEALGRVSSVFIPADGRWRIDLWTEDVAGNRSVTHSEEIGLDRTVPAPPSLHSNMWQNRADLIRGYSQRWDRPANIAEVESGICGYAMLVDEMPTSIPQPAIDIVKGDVTAARIWPDVSDGLNYVHLRTVSCAGFASDTATELLPIDDSSPSLSISGTPASGWSRQPVDLRISAADALSGVRHVFTSLDGGPEVVINDDETSLRVGAGLHRLVYGAEDATGNRTHATAEIRVDDEPPEIWFDPHDRAHPISVHASIHDAVSGIDFARLEFRRVDVADDSPEATWRGLSPTEHTPNDTDSRLDLRADLPDQDLPDGVYAVRAVATDRAGNVSRSGRTLFDGDQLLIQIPERERLSLTAGLSLAKKRCVTNDGKACPKGYRCVTGRMPCVNKEILDRSDALPFMRLPYRSTAARLVGELLHRNGNPVAGASLGVFATPKNGRPTHVANVISDIRGRFTFAVPAGTSRAFVVRFKGSDAIAPAESAPATVGVRGGVSLHVSRRHARSGQSITFTGRLASGAEHVPADGKLVTIQYFDGKRWEPFKTPRTDREGRFRVTKSRLARYAHPTRVFFRATVPSDALWPFETGFSSNHSVLIRP